jgi:hypothetical protein
MSMTHCTKERIGLFRALSILHLSVLLLFALLGTALRAQTIQIKLVDGRSGRTMADKCTYVAVGNRSNPNSGSPLQTQTDKDGAVTLHLTDGGANINNAAQNLVCGLSGVINPVVKYGDTIYIRPGYVLCQLRSPDYSWLAMANFSTEEVLQHGIATANTCGKATASPKPGELTIFVRPLTWWEKLKQ